MTRISFIPSLFLAILLAGCASSDSDTSTVLEDAALPSSPRPDADNPVPGNMAWPADWEIRFDRPSDDYVVAGDSSVANPDIFFTNMAPGWHVTSGPAAIYWHPASTAEGDYTVSATIFQFDPGPRNEAFGFFVGGSDLSGDAHEYLYFLIRKSGEYLVKLRRGDQTESVVGWTANDAILPWSADNDPTPNALSVQTEGDTISFLVNDTVVHSQAKGDLPTDGIVGFRVNHALNLHYATFDVAMAEATAAE
ncbi:MAG: hypothetical protein ACO37D_07100 [Rhodothermales bacterium]